MIHSNSDAYYEIIDSKGYHVIVLGEIEEQWTDEVLDMFKREDIKAHFFPWRSCLELRLQLEIVYYPYTQLWLDGELKMELTGYHNESIKNLIEKIK